MRKKLRTLHSRIGEVRFLFLVLICWSVFFSLGLFLTGYGRCVPGFLLGAGGSAGYAWMLHRRVPRMLENGVDSGKMGSAGNRWLKILQPIALLLILVLLLSRLFREGSFLAALFGFFSFQVSLFVYMVLITLNPSFLEKE